MQSARLLDVTDNCLPAAVIQTDQLDPMPRVCLIMRTHRPHVRVVKLAVRDVKRQTYGDVNDVKNYAVCM